MKKARFVGSIEEVPAAHPATVATFEEELEYIERSEFDDEELAVAEAHDNIIAGFWAFLGAGRGSL